MSKYDPTRPVSSIKHDDKRAAIPDSAHQGEEQMAISGMPEQSEYDIFRHEFQHGRDPELYWLNKYKNDDEDNPDYMPQLRTDIRSLYKHEDIRPEATICSIFSSILAMYFSFLVLGWEKTAKIQKKRDIPKGQPHFLALKIVYGYAAAKMTFDIMPDVQTLHVARCIY